MDKLKTLKRLIGITGRLFWTRTFQIIIEFLLLQFFLGKLHIFTILQCTNYSTRILLIVFVNWNNFCSLYSIFTAMEPTMMNTTMTTNAMTANVTEVMGRSAMEQGGYQMAALCLTLAIAIVGGVITGNLYMCLWRVIDNFFVQRKTAEI